MAVRQPKSDGIVSAAASIPPADAAALTIAVDAMGSDAAPTPEVQGAALAARAYGAHVILVGQQSRIRPLWSALPEDLRSRIEILHAEQAIGMEEKAVHAVRTKRESSLHVACRLVREGRAAGLVSAGNTGAVMACAKMILGSLPGVQRPALAAVFPTATGRASVLLDVGANVDCRPDHLAQFAVMGEIYYRVIFGADRPRVGLLSIGEEETKGNELTRESFALLRKLPLEFCGNVEGRDLYNGKSDVIVCDGFVGNVALKISEGLVETVRKLLRESLASTLAGKVGYVLSRQAYAMFRQRLDYSEYGGAPLLGVRGVVIISHGSSNPNAIKNAIRVARESHQRRVNAAIEAQLARAGDTASRSEAGRMETAHPLN